MRDPNYALNYDDENKQADLAYEKAYELYKSGQYYDADVAIDNIFKKYPNTIITDRLALLRTLILAKRNKLDAYEDALNAFINDYKTSELIPFASELLAQINEYSPDGEEKLIVIDTTYTVSYRHLTLPTTSRV